MLLTLTREDSLAVYFTPEIGILQNSLEWRLADSGGFSVTFSTFFSLENFPDKAPLSATRHSLSH
jgi:hypothetical protein